MNHAAILVCLLALGCESAPSPSSNKAPASTVPSAQPMQWAGPEPVGPWGDLAVSCAFNDFGHIRAGCLICAVKEAKTMNEEERVVCWWVKP